jgi:hypothetical protein
MKTYEQALENLYAVFAKYPLKDMECCDCGCDRTVNKRVLMTTPLRQIEEDAIGYYAFKATYTMGDLADFKHFLPRIFEFLYEVDTRIVLKKLDENDFESWETAEINALKGYLKYWLMKMIKNHYINEEFITGLANKIDLKTIFYSWLNFKEATAISNLTTFINGHYHDVIHKNRFGELKNNEYELVSMLKSWFHSKELKERLENAYYEVMDKNEDLAKQIEEADYIITH